MAEAARMVEAVGADLIDLNFGCPVKKVTKTGAGAHAARRPRPRLPHRRGDRRRPRRPSRSRCAAGFAERLTGLPVLGPRLVDAGASALTLHPRSANQMYTGTADHRSRLELVSLVDVPVIASGDITSRAKAQSVLATTGAAGDGRPRRAGQSLGARRDRRRDAPEPTREEVVAELVLFMRETVRELGERRAAGFLKKFYGWYLAGGGFPRAFRQELVQLPTHGRDRAATACLHPRRAPAPRTARGRAPGRRRGHPGAADLGLRRRAERPSRLDASRRSAVATPRPTYTVPLT